MIQLIVGVALGYFFKPQIDNLIKKIRNKKKEDNNWEDE